MGAYAPSHTCLACGDSIHGCLCVYGRHIPGFCGGASSFILSSSPPRPHWLLATLGWSVIHFWEPLHSNYQRGVRGKVSSWDGAAHAALWSSMEYFKLRGSHFQLAYHQLHLPWLPTRQLIWHFRKYSSWRGFLSKGHCLWGRDISWYL